LNDWQKERQFKALNEKKEERGLKVIRDGVETIVDVRVRWSSLVSCLALTFYLQEVVVGDIALLEPGEIIPCDGLFISGHNVQCDESTATGETDAIKKVSYEDCLQLRAKLAKEGGKHFEQAHTDCFVISGSKVQEGVGKYVIVGVGEKSFNGRILMGMLASSFSDH